MHVLGYPYAHAHRKLRHGRQAARDFPAMQIRPTFGHPRLNIALGCACASPRHDLPSRAADKPHASFLPYESALGLGSRGPKAQVAFVLRILMSFLIVICDLMRMRIDSSEGEGWCEKNLNQNGDIFFLFSVCLPRGEGRCCLLVRVRIPIGKTHVCLFLNHVATPALFHATGRQRIFRSLRSGFAPW